MEGALPEGPRGRALALALTATVLMAVWLGCAQPLLQWHAARAELLAQRRALMLRMTQLAATLPKLQHQIAGERPQATALLEGPSDAIAGAALQGVVQSLAKQASIGLNSVETLPSEPRGAYRRVGLRIELSAQWPELMQLLRSVGQEATPGTPKMLIDDLQIRAPPLQLRPVSAPVRASFTVFAFRATAGDSRNQNPVRTGRQGEE